MNPPKILLGTFPSSNTFLKPNNIMSVGVPCSIMATEIAPPPLHKAMAEKFVIILPESKYLETVSAMKLHNID